MHKVKITVLSVELKPTLIERYGYPKMETCPKHQEGEKFITDFRKPNALCEDAWGCMEKFVFTLAHTSEPLFWNDWSRQGKAVVCCNDGYRPVTFLLETLDEEARPF
ncbi:TIGR04076 family protein [Pantoea ananatis]|nr:TIGR04076 family protein [Pantoea ananatis]